MLQLLLLWHQLSFYCWFSSLYPYTWLPLWIITLFLHFQLYATYSCQYLLFISSLVYSKGSIFLPLKLPFLQPLHFYYCYHSSGLPDFRPGITTEYFFSIQSPISSLSNLVLFLSHIGSFCFMPKSLQRLSRNLQSQVSPTPNTVVYILLLASLPNVCFL